MSLGGRSFIEGLPIGLGLHAALIPCFPRPAFLLYPFLPAFLPPFLPAALPVGLLESVFACTVQQIP